MRDGKSLNRQVGQAAEAILVQFGGPPMADLDEEIVVRSVAAGQLGRMASDRASDPLIALDDPEPYVRA